MSVRSIRGGTKGYSVKTSFRLKTETSHHCRLAPVLCVVRALCYKDVALQDRTIITQEISAASLASNRNVFCGSEILFGQSSGNFPSHLRFYSLLLFTFNLNASHSGKNLMHCCASKGEENINKLEPDS